MYLCLLTSIYFTYFPYLTTLLPYYTLFSSLFNHPTSISHSLFFFFMPV